MINGFEPQTMKKPTRFTDLTETERYALYDHYLKSGNTIGKALATWDGSPVTYECLAKIISLKLAGKSLTPKAVHILSSEDKMIVFDYYYMTGKKFIDIATHFPHMKLNYYKVQQCIKYGESQLKKFAEMNDVK